MIQTQTSSELCFVCGGNQQECFPTQVIKKLKPLLPSEDYEHVNGDKGITIGFKINNKYICLSCYLLLGGLEKQYGKPAIELLDNEEAVKIIGNLLGGEITKLKIYNLVKLRLMRKSFPKHMIEKWKENL